jgi:hypothetical protein
MYAQAPRPARASLCGTAFAPSDPPPPLLQQSLTRLPKKCLHKPRCLQDDSCPRDGQRTVLHTIHNSTGHSPHTPYRQTLHCLSARKNQSRHAQRRAPHDQRVWVCCARCTCSRNMQGGRHGYARAVPQGTNQTRDKDQRPSHDMSHAC